MSQNDMALTRKRISRPLVLDGRMKRALGLADAARAACRLGPDRDRKQSIEQDVALDVEAERQPEVTSAKLKEPSTGSPTSARPKSVSPSPPSSRCVASQTPSPSGLKNLTSHVGLEVSEDVYLGRRDRVVAREIAALRDAGVLVALDDFGTGHASLTHLLNVPVDIIKIDRSFVARLWPDDPSMVIVEGVNRRPNGTPYRRVKGTPFEGRVAVVPVVHRRGPRPAPRAATSAGGDGRGRSLWTHRVNRRDGGPGEGFSASVLEAPAVVAGFDDVAMVGNAVEQRGRHLGVTEDGWPLAKGEVGGDDDRGALVELADEMEEQLAA